MYKFDKKLILVVGNIGSGKSTYIKTRNDCIVVSRDSLRYMFGNGSYIFDKKLEPAVHAGTVTIVEELMQSGVNIILDEVNVSKRLRFYYVNLANQYGYTKEAIILPKLDKETSLNRRMQNPHGHPNREKWAEVWDMFDKLYEEPIKEEGFDVVVRLNI